MTDVNQTYPAPVHPTPPPLVHVSGTYREMGRQIGEAQRSAVQNSIQNARGLLKGIGRAPSCNPKNTCRSP